MLQKKKDPKNNIDQKVTETFYRNRDFTGNMIALNSYLSIVTLNVNSPKDEMAQAFRLDKKMGPIHMLPTRDSF